MWESRVQVAGRDFMQALDRAFARPLIDGVNIHLIHASMHGINRYTEPRRSCMDMTAGRVAPD
jgi:hypothetical protein